MKNQLRLIKILAAAVMLMPFLFSLCLVIPNEQTSQLPLVSDANNSTLSKGFTYHHCDQISCGEIEYVKSDRSIRGTIMNGSEKCSRKSLSTWKNECSQLIFIEGSTLVNKDNACYISNNNDYRIILNSGMQFRSSYSSIPDIFVKCSFSD